MFLSLSRSDRDEQKGGEIPESFATMTAVLFVVFNKVVICCIISLSIGLKGYAVVAGLTGGSVIDIGSKRSIPGYITPNYCVVHICTMI